MRKGTLGRVRRGVRMNCEFERSHLHSQSKSPTSLHPEKSEQLTWRSSPGFAGPRAFFFTAVFG